MKNNAFLSGTASGFVNGLFGSGGGSLLVPLLERSGLPAQNSHAVSVAVIFPVSLFSALLYSRNGFPLHEALPFIPFGMAGAWAGAKLLPKIPQKLLKRIFGGLILLSAVRLWTR